MSRLLPSAVTGAATFRLRRLGERVGVLGSLAKGCRAETLQLLR
jgi:hypothetical protein